VSVRRRDDGCVRARSARRARMRSLLDARAATSMSLGIARRPACALFVNSATAKRSVLTACASVEQGGALEESEAVKARPAHWLDDVAAPYAARGRPAEARRDAAAQEEGRLSVGRPAGIPWSGRCGLRLRSRQRPGRSRASPRDDSCAPRLWETGSPKRARVRPSAREASERERNERASSSTLASAVTARERLSERSFLGCESCAAILPLSWPAAPRKPAAPHLPRRQSVDATLAVHTAPAQPRGALRSLLDVS